MPPSSETNSPPNSIDLELVSFKLCPFVQRSVITLKVKNAPFRIRYVDLADPPAWFLQLSPSKKVPLLVIDGAQVLFESSVINEFIDEVTPGRLLPEDPLRRALDRSWIEYGSNCLMDTLHMTTVESVGEFSEVVQAHNDKLALIETELGEGPHFHGAVFSLVDAAYAPLWMRLMLLGRFSPVFQSERFPKLARWSAALLKLPAVTGSMVPDFEELYEALIRRRGGYLSTLLPADGNSPPAPRSRY